MEWTKDECIAYLGDISHCSVRVYIDKQDLVDLLNKVIDGSDREIQIREIKNILGDI